MPLSTSKADWLSWFLQFIVGTVVGCIVGFVIIQRRRYGFWMSPDLTPYFLSGTSLFCAGFASLLGDRLWIRSNYRVIPPDAPRHSFISLIASSIMVFLGSVLMVLSILIQLGILPRLGIL